MTFKELEKIYKNIYGENHVERNSYDYKTYICPDILFSLDYDDDDFRNSVVLNSNKDETEFYLSDGGDSFSKFNEKQIFEVMPTIKNLMKKYNVELINHEFVKKLECFNEEYLKKTTSDFACFVFSVWYFVLHLSMYTYAILERGYYYDETIEEKLLYIDENFESVIEKCKKEINGFMFDEHERMYYVLENNEKKYLVKALNGYVFSDLRPRKEDIISNPSFFKSEHSFDEIKEMFKNLCDGRFDETDCSYTTIVYEKNEPIKLYLKEDKGVYYFTDNGKARENYKKDCTKEKFATLVDCFDLKNNEIRYYLPSKINSRQFTYNIERNIHYMVLTSKDLNEFDFSLVGKFYTQLNSYENLKEFMKNITNAKITDFNTYCICQYTIDDKNFNFNLEKGKEFNYLSLENKFTKETLNSLIDALKRKNIFFDKSNNMFKIKIFENDAALISNRIYEFLEFIVLSNNYEKILRKEHEVILEENFETCSINELKNELNKFTKEKFFGIYLGEYKFGFETKYTTVIYFFNTFYDGTKRVTHIEIREQNGKLFMLNKFLNKAFLNNDHKEEIVNLIKIFGLNNFEVNLKNYKRKIKNMFMFLVCAKLLGYIEK